MTYTYHMTASAFDRFIRNHQTFTPDQYRERLTPHQLDAMQAHGIQFTIHRDKDGHPSQVTISTDTDTPEHLTTDPASSWNISDAYQYAHAVSAST